MKVLITGGAGFIGSHLAEAFCLRGDAVTVIDNLRSGKLENLVTAQQTGNLQFVQDDVLTADLDKLLVGFDLVYHQAAIPSVAQSVADPVGSNRFNLDCTLRVLTSARTANVGRVVFASSAAVYGNTEVECNTEDQAVHPLSPYALQKYASERYTQLFSHLFGLDTVALRYFNVFGPRQDPTSPYSGVISRFCLNALQGKPLSVYGDGQQTRDFVFVKNVVNANILAGTAPRTAVAGKVFNVATQQRTSLLELIAQIQKFVDSAIITEFKPAAAGDIRHSLANIQAITVATGYLPTYNLASGLKETMDWYRRELNRQ